MRTWFMPLEPLPERYTEQMHRWVTEAFERRGIDHAVVWPLGTEVEQSGSGDFLHWRQRVEWSYEQLYCLTKAWDEVEENDAVLFADLWHPGLSGIAYLSQMTGKPVRIYAVHYAGPLDPTDLTAKRLESWSRVQDVAWMLACRRVFVGSEFHADLLVDQSKRLFGVDVATAVYERVEVTGLVWDESSARAQREPGSFRHDERPLVLWPHRYSSDKCPGLFFDAAEPLREQARFVITTGRDGARRPKSVPAWCEWVPTSKGQYYDAMAKASLVVSTAKHENFGYTLREAAMFGTPYLAPRRACYPEFVLASGLYEPTAQELEQRMRRHLSGAAPVPPLTLPETPGIEAMLDAMERDA